MVAVADINQDLALALASAMDGFVVYPAPPDVVAGKSIVIAPRAPYRKRSDYWFQEVSLQIMVLIPRVAGGRGYHELDGICDQIIPIVESVDTDNHNIVWESVDSLGQTVEVGGVEYMSATLYVTAYLRGEE